MTCSYTSLKIELMHQIYRVGVIGFGSFDHFKLYENDRDAPPSPFWLNFRTRDHPTHPGPLTSDLLSLIGRVWRQQTKELVYDAVVAIPLAADKLLDAFQEVGSPMPRVRMWKTHSSEDGTRAVTGISDAAGLTSGLTLPFDDVVSRGDSKFEAIRVLQNGGFTVERIVVVVDREQGGRELLAQVGCEVSATLTATELFRLGQEQGYITGEQVQMAQLYLEQMRQRLSFA